MELNVISESSQGYSKPELVSLGTAKELTQSVNVVQSGDQSFSVIDS